MADNQYYNKMILGSEILFDLTGDTIKASDLKSGVTAHDKSGAPITGTNTYDVNSTDATVAVAEILKDKTAYARGSKLTGTMPNNASVTGTISTKEGTFSIAQGYHDGGGKVSILKTEQDKIIAKNIRENVTILGVTGTMSGSEDMKPESKSVTPNFSSQEILPGTGYNCLSSVTVAAIPYTETDNSAGGKTLTIG